jgi:hypothetical protein
MQTPSRPAEPALPAPVLAPGQRVVVTNVPQSPSAIYRGFVAQRRELRDQLEALQNTRGHLTNQLQEPTARGADRTGLEQRIASIDARIAAVDKQLAGAEADVARSAGVPGAVVEPPHFEQSDPPDGVFVVGGLALLVGVLPLSIAWARRIMRRGPAVATALPAELMDRLSRLDHAVDSIAVEVERIGEGQRFVTRVLAERGTPELLAADVQPGTAPAHAERPAR